MASTYINLPIEAIAEILGPVTLFDVATETTLLSVDAWLASIDGKVATETTLLSVDSTLSTIAALDFATETTLLSVDSYLASIAAEDFATQTTLAAISVQLPATLGQKTMANSFAVTLASDQTQIPVSQSGNWSVFSSGYQGTFTDRSGQATVASSQVAAANANRRYFFISNISNAIIWINFGTAATTASPSIPLNAGDSFVMEANFINTESVNVIAASGTRDYVAKEG